ncbi:hypothetical protein [Yoonia sp.]|uniref:hypothetical protein n=1 Tax=Yoonia sp. TaxID=2212373 RepID=UPI00391DDDB8
MDNWKNTSVILCVDRSGEQLSVIEQSKVGRVKQTLSASSSSKPSRRFVLGNGAPVKSLDVDRFMLLDTKEVVTRI